MSLHKLISTRSSSCGIKWLINIVSWLLCVQIESYCYKGISAMMMAIQTPVLSISIQDMCLCDVISMSRHKNFDIKIKTHDSESRGQEEAAIIRETKKITRSLE